MVPTDSAAELGPALDAPQPRLEFPEVLDCGGEAFGRIHLPESQADSSRAQGTTPRKRKVLRIQIASTLAQALGHVQLQTLRSRPSSETSVRPNQVFWSDPIFLPVLSAGPRHLLMLDLRTNYRSASGAVRPLPLPWRRPHALTMVDRTIHWSDRNVGLYSRDRRLT